MTEPTGDGQPPAPLHPGSTLDRRRSPQAGAPWLLLVVLLILGIGCDQGSKAWAEGPLLEDHGGSRRLFTAGSFSWSYSYVRNPGAAWGLLANQPARFRKPFFLAVSLVALLLIFTLFSKTQRTQRRLAFALGLLLSGAVGNLIDRLRLGYVIDFIDLRYHTMRWPTFNIADVLISVGVVLLVLDWLLTARQQRREPSA